MTASVGLNELELQSLQAAFGERLQLNVPLARFTSARVGGLAAAFIPADSRHSLAQMAMNLWKLDMPFMILGGGSNVLVSDAGFRGVVLYNRARQVIFSEDCTPPVVRADSGVNFGALARQAASRGLGGLEWAAGIPGTVGGAVVGNAGAHGGEVSGNLLLAEILHRGIGVGASNDDSRTDLGPHPESWTVERLEFGYRTSRLKRRWAGSAADQPVGQAPTQPEWIVLEAVFRLERSPRETLQAKLDELVAFRRRTQPPGASMGSMFKNPPGDYAGRLIEAAGLKGTRIGDAEISTMHANFFINHGSATAADIWRLIQRSREAVIQGFGIALELEIELVGDWSGKGR
ncbi:MAG TPA: UDP-N-acetylmuramate dehydrogenase [Anaerolineales bacterium]|nr:UDP-N-acetylmuramate dehydrogenase [Anaerolineales bacterium]